jgi:pyruvate/2-oxoglutarate/acetoin dehydrogenase E1 component
MIASVETGAWFGSQCGTVKSCTFHTGRRQRLLKAAIRDDSPVVYFEDKMMYKLKDPVSTVTLSFRSALRM